MKTMQGIRVRAGLLAVTAAAIGLSGCVGGPTYGTSKTSGEQLMDDLGQSLAFQQEPANKDTRYNPRPQLVVNKKTESVLPPPQASLAGRENNPNWIESPEETRARLRQEAEDNRNNPNYRSPLLAGNGTAGTLTESQKWEAFRQAKANAESPGIAGQRRTLTEPPVQYRVADDAALTDLGEPEAKKERERKKSAAAASANTSSWWNPFK
ncbi:hypothetical protein ACQKGC_24590 [Allorhizobium pseudoryzae]|jgi:hypothetical protein|uniref:hypothetical protein n=1 Tax=Allorhizobium pseudoryzae TaxID=379684 RepID=UPI003CFCEC31